MDALLQCVAMYKSKDPQVRQLLQVSHIAQCCVLYSCCVRAVLRFCAVCCALRSVLMYKREDLQVRQFPMFALVTPFCALCALCSCSR